jgi:ribosomal protein L37E
MWGYFGAGLTRDRLLYCTRCGATAPPKKHTPGSIGVELLLWLLLILPGVLYSAWRLHARREVCSACGGTDLIPPDSPRARLSP